MVTDYDRVGLGSAAMRVELIEGRKAIGGLQANWKSVYDADPEANYFLSYEWLFGTPEGVGRFSRLGFVLAVRASATDPDFVAFLPLRLETKYDTAGFFNELHLGGNYPSDYNGFICRPEYEQDAIPALGEKLRRMNWRHLRLLHLSASRDRADLLMRDFSVKVFKTKSLGLVNPDGIDNSICPSTTLTQDWDDFLQKKVSSNTRQKIRRFLRQIEGSEDYHITHTSDETIERDIRVLTELWADRWGERKGKRLQTIQDTQRRKLKHAFATKTLFMPMLWHGDRPVCVLGIFVDQRKKVYNFYIAGRDGSFNGPPTGLVMHAYAIRHAISNGFEKYDFLRGNEAYKYSFGPEEAFIRSYVVSTKSNENLGSKLNSRCLGRVLRNSKELYRLGDLAAAQRGFAQILDVDPRYPSAPYLHGLVSAKRGDHDMAITQFKALVRLQPDSAKIWYRLGRSQIAKKDRAKAALLHDLS